MKFMDTKKLTEEERSNARKWLKSTAISRITFALDRIIEQIIDDISGKECVAGQEYPLEFKSVITSEDLVTVGMIRDEP